MIHQLTILYEDRCGDGQIREFGPHVLVQQCVCDALGMESWVLRQQLMVHGIPKNGATKLRSECRSDRPKFGRDGSDVIAVYDNDRIRDFVKVGAPGCKAQLREALRAESTLKERLVVVLLEENLETVVAAVCACDPAIAPKEVQENAIKRKKVFDRDIVLRRAAAPTAEGKRLREQLQAKVPSLRYLVGKIVAIYRKLVVPTG